MKHILYLILILTLAACGGNTGGTASDPHGDHDEHEGHSHEGESDEVEITPVQMQTVGIRLGRLEKRDMADVMSATGSLEVRPQDEAVASSPLPGTVRRICVVAGQKVRAGEALAYVEAPEVASLRSAYGEAAQELAAARRELDRQEALAAQGAGVRKNLDAARSRASIAEIRERGAKEALQRVHAGETGTTVAVVSPISGTVVSVETTTGAFADMQTPVARVVDNSGVYCRLDLLEKDIAKIKPGMEVEMRLTNDPSRTFGGRVADINPTLDPTTRTIPVRVALAAGPGQQLIPGMAVTARVVSAGEAVDALPEAAVVSSGGKSYIFVLEDSGNGTHSEEGVLHFRKTEVMTGQTSFGYTAVTPLQPLPDGAQVVTTGAFYLNSMASDHGEHSH